MQNTISGFSKRSKSEKIEWLVNSFFDNSEDAKQTLQQYWNTNEALQQLHDDFSENTISNYYLPYGVAPNFIIDNTPYTIPMVTEESSVVAAASNAAKFWQNRGGFKTRVISTTKIGHVHFMYTGSSAKLEDFFNTIKPQFLNDTNILTASMAKRGGGILDIELNDKTKALQHYYQIEATFETKDAMGANFINSCLEQFASTLERGFNSSSLKQDSELDIVMSILSNYVPQCIVRAEVSCPVESLKQNGISGEDFAKKFMQAITIAEVEPYRAVTHNKGIMNGIDSVIVATGNDFRAVEAGVHAYAAKDGNYTSLTHAKITDNTFTFWIDVPLALGTVGGLTALHPLVKFSLQLLKNPTAPDLMRITATAGLAQNFAAIKSLITTGIQQGHMKMHLMNILNQLKATPNEKEKIKVQFKDKAVSVTNVKQALSDLRQ